MILDQVQERDDGERARTTLQIREYYVELTLSYSFDEIAARFHHRHVSIHPFANGNGRHARLMTDLLLKSVGQPKFSWGQKMPNKYSVIRKTYIDALRTADALKDYRPLLNFVRK